MCNLLNKDPQERAGPKILYMRTQEIRIQERPALISFSTIVQFAISFPLGNFSTATVVIYFFWFC